MKRQVYLRMKSLEEAKEILFKRFGSNSTGSETVNSVDASGRVTAEPIFARCSAPNFHSSAMDGIAVKANRTYGIMERSPGLLKIGRDAIWINTGQRLPDGFDAVIMVEKVHQVDDEHIEIRSPAYPWQHVRKVGEDIVASQLLFPQNHRLRAYDLGALISGGVFLLKVRVKPRVVIIPTGSELVNHSSINDPNSLEDGRLIEYNSIILAGLVEECDAVPVISEIVPDDTALIKQAVMNAVASDAHIIIINAGSSAGSRDYTMGIIEEMGEVLVHGVAMMPGKPTILGEIGGKPVIGNPGYSVSSALSFDQFVTPLIYMMQGLNHPARKSVKVRTTRDIPSRPGIEEFLRVNIGEIDGHYVATPLSRAAGSITTLTRAEGILRIPALSEGISQKEEVNAELFVREEELQKTIVVIGSHDMTIDLIADQIKQDGSGIRIASSNVGSLGGLIALRKGTGHIAGSHLLDTDTGQYNLSYIERYLKGIPVSVFHLVLRDQGLMIAKGNPKNIKGIEDLTRHDITFVNRQAGSGTRILLEYKLSQLGIDPSIIRGYKHEEFTHMAVAVDVLSGAADCGMGIYAAAKALNIDFIPVEQEQYDLIIPTSVIERSHIQAVLNVIRSESFRKRVVSMGGYDPSLSGQLWVETEV